MFWWQTGQKPSFKIMGVLVFTASFQPPFVQPPPPPSPIVRPLIIDTAPSFTPKPPPAPGTIVGNIGWFAPPEKFLAPLVVTVEQPPIFAPRPPPPPAGILNNIGWFAPRDDDKRSAIYWVSIPPAIALTPATLPVLVSGSAWNVLPDYYPNTHVRWIECSPAFSFTKYHRVLGARITILKGDILVNPELSGDPQ